MEAIERIVIIGRVYRRAALRKIEETERTPEREDLDWYYAWIPESRFGIEYPSMPIDKIAN